MDGSSIQSGNAIPQPFDLGSCWIIRSGFSMNKLVPPPPSQLLLHQLLTLTFHLLPHP
jgi:hypothetical protein